VSAGAEGGTRAVVTALAANFGIAVAKFAGFAITRSSSMGAEAVHSLADCGNQVLLLVGAKRAERLPDDRHPFGYGPEKFFWALLVSVVLFVIGAGFAFLEGADKVLHPHAVDHVPVAVGILAVAVVLESLSFHTVIGESNKVRAGRSWPAFLRETKNPDLILVFLEDAAALTGLTVALAGLGLYELTGSGVFDGVASLLIGVVLGAVALIMGIEMKSLLVGEAADPADIGAISDAILSVAAIDRIIHLRTRHLGPDELLVAAKVAVSAAVPSGATAAAVDDAERCIRQAVPSAHYIFLEVDIDRDALPGASQPAP
jgi:cation diffusion facilitator family transporter